jgi:endonuclease/exonuclease/phosphatase (EEP) superfamily protein YafD
MESEPLSSNDDAAPGRRIRYRTLIIVCCLTIPWIHPLAQWTARLDWRMDLLTHFQEPALAATILCLLSSLIARIRPLSILLVVLAVYQVVPLTTVWLPNPVPASRATGKPVRVLMANVFDVNDRYDLVLGLIREEQPDVVGLVELTTRWEAAMDRSDVIREYPYRRSIPIGSSGLALWFRNPPVEFLPLETLTPFGNPIQGARFRLGDRDCTLWLVHPPNPLINHEVCNEEIIALGRRIGEASGTRVVLGDFNRTDGSPYFADFVRLSGLRDSRVGFGRQSSWPNWSPYRIAIDHAFVSDDVAVLSRRIGPDVGSDHRPLLLDLAPARIESRSEETR